MEPGKHKGYDTTLARMAGNIAAGIEGNAPMDYTALFIAQRSIEIAKRIIELCKEQSKRDDTNNA